jgi:hypothetical protein
LTLSDNWLWLALFAELGEKKEKSCEPLLGRIEQLIDKVFFNPTVADQQIRHEQFRTFVFFVNGGNHGRLLQTGNLAFIHRPGCCDAPRISIQTAFSSLGPKNGDDRLIALLGNDVELDIVSLDVKSCIRERSL